MKVLIMGMGEVGQAIHSHEEQFADTLLTYDLDARRSSIGDPGEENVDIMHVCIPWSSSFVTDVLNASGANHAKLVIIHSTVPVGTTRKIKEGLKDVSVVHSPIRGKHPNLAESVYVFKKYVGGEDKEVKEACKHLESMDIETVPLESYEASELLKLLDTEYYGWNILFAKYAKFYCDKYGVDYDKVYTDANTTYNEGYSDMEMEHVIRPVLYPPEGKISGHCVSENNELLEESNLKKFFKELNENEAV